MPPPRGRVSFRGQGNTAYYIDTEGTITAAGTIDEQWGIGPEKMYRGYSTSSDKWDIWSSNTNPIADTGADLAAPTTAHVYLPPLVDADGQVMVARNASPTTYYRWNGTGWSAGLAGTGGFSPRAVLPDGRLAVKNSSQDQLFLVDFDAGTETRIFTAADFTHTIDGGDTDVSANLDCLSFAATPTGCLVIMGRVDGSFDPATTFLGSGTAYYHLSPAGPGEDWIIDDYFHLSGSATRYWGHTLNTVDGTIWGHYRAGADEWHIVTLTEDGTITGNFTLSGIYAPESASNPEEIWYGPPLSDPVVPPAPFDGGHMRLGLGFGRRRIPASGS